MTENIKNGQFLSLPLVPLCGIVAFPKLSISFDVYRPTSKTALEIAQKNDTHIILAPQLDVSNDDINLSNLSKIGVCAKIKRVSVNKKGVLSAVLEGVERVELTSVSLNSGFYICEAISCPTVLEEDRITKKALLRDIRSSVNTLLSNISSSNGNFGGDIFSSDDLSYVSDIAALDLIVDYKDRISVLCQTNEYQKANLIISLLEEEITIGKLEAKIHKKTSERMEANQRDYYLREQLKVIQNELGQDALQDSDELYDKIKAAKLPQSIEEKLLKDLSKMSKLPFGSQEASLLKAYIEACLEIPFGKFSKDTANVAAAEKILQRDHYGLLKVKERILEFIAVKQLNPDVKNQIICLVGPPGVGKTSLCASIARALKRKYVRVSLGGVRDEADIRGHRKTYVGAMPGRIINALCEAQTLNPLIVLDEIDKMSSDMRGDPASAMLEVLDSEQNKAFRDHFIEMDVDLSHCMFIATANTLDSIPAPLIDRMEIIELSSYTIEEKFHIAKNHLIPKQLKLHGLTKKAVKISDAALKLIIENYTAEAGVRSLERCIASLLRKASKDLIENNATNVTITESNLEKYLGVRKFETEKIDENDLVGVVNGMAYTSIGGDLLKIEASVMKGNGKLQLTGKLGDVMKESCEIAISFIRENADKLGIDPDFYAKNDIHIHVPEGAVPKDGPSAGVTMVTALVSVLTGKAVKKDLSMTGEITLRGKVLPIGGLKEKTIAAYIGGVKQIVIPYGNVKDLEEIDEAVRKNVEFIPCKTIFDVLNAAFRDTDKEFIAIINQYAEVSEK